MNASPRKQEIFSTASRLFKEKGYTAVTMRDLAAEVGIKAASLYNHIASKEEILQQVIMTIAERFTKGIEEICHSQSDTREKLSQVIAQHVNLTANHPYGMASLNNDWMHLGKEKQRYLELRSAYEQHFREIIKRGKSQGILKDIDEQVILFSTLGTLRNLYLWIPKKADLNRDKLIKSLRQTLLEGIAQ